MMGGFGSTRWAQHAKKITVESCLRLGINDMMRGGLDPYRSGRATVHWEHTFTGKEYASMTLECQVNVIWFSYRVRGTQYTRDVRCRVQLESTPCHFGGVRFWFTCPGCARRVGCLYVAPYNWQLLCRTCHDLAYTSAQTAHSDDRGHVLKRAIVLMEKQAKLMGALERCKRWSKRKRRLYGKYLEIHNELRLIGRSD